MIKNQEPGKRRLVKKYFELSIVRYVKNGIMPAQIAIKENISMPRLSYYLSSLIKQKVLKEIGKGVWEVDPVQEVKMLSHKGAPQVGGQVKNVRGHAFIWKIKPSKQINWKQALDRKEIQYELKGLQGTPRIELKGKKVWLGQNYITIFESEFDSHFATNPIEAKKDAIFGMIDVIDFIKMFAGEFKYQFTCKRQHYGFVNSPEALHFVKEGKRILIKNEKGYWFSIDFSQNKYMEAETIHEQDADIDGMGYQRLMNSHEKTSFKVTPEFTLLALNRVTANQEMFAKNIETHMNVLKDIGSAVIELKDQVKKLGENK